MATRERIRLLDLTLELGRELTSGERTELGAMTLPVVTVDSGPLDLGTLLRDNDAFAATIVDGMLLRSLQIGDQFGVHLLGPGDLLFQASSFTPAWLEESTVRVPASTRLALLDRDTLSLLLGRAPQVVPALLDCVAEQMQRLTGQLVICQLPRVDRRVLAMLWLLAETWGQVTTDGVRLPLALTHETIGALVGARRPTVTLALAKLCDEGSVVRRDPGWLLLEPPPTPVPVDGPEFLAQGFAGVSPRQWLPTPEPALDPQSRPRTTFPGTAGSPHRWGSLIWAVGQRRRSSG